MTIGFCKRLFATVATIALLSLNPQMSTCQDDINVLKVLREVSFRDSQKPLYRLGLNGDVVASYRTKRDLERVIDFYDSTIVQDYLTLLDYQKPEYNKIVEKWRKNINKLEQDFEKRVLVLNSVLEKLIELDQQAKTELDAVLLPQQMRDLEAVQIRFLINTYGLEVLHKVESLRDASDVSRDEIQNVKSVTRRIRPDIERRATDIRMKVLDKLVEPLTAEQQNETIKKWKPLVAIKSSQLELLAWQLEIKKEGRFTQKRPFENLVNLPIFTILVDGQLTELEAPEYEFKSRAPHDIVMSIGNMARSNLIEGIDGVDVQQITAKLKEYTKTRAEFSHQQWEQRAAGVMTLAEAREQADKYYQGLADETLDSLKELLPVDVYLRISDHAQKLVVLGLGPMYDLMYGELSQKLQLSKEEKNKLLKAAKSAKSLLAKESCELEAFIMNEYLNVLDDKSKKWIAKSIGDRVNPGVANIRMILHKN